MTHVAAGAALACGVARGAAVQPRMNVVLFLVDDLGWMDTTPYGSRYYETPNVARLAARSMRFTNGYSAAPLCSATRASIMTGKYPGRLHFTGAGGHVPAPQGPLLPAAGPPTHPMLLPRDKGYLPLEEYTLAEALRDAGYRTGFVGKWHLGHDERYWPTHQGFDVNRGGGRWPGPPSYFSPYHIDTLPDGPEGEYLPDRLTDEAIAFIEADSDKPFFLNFWQYAVHAPYQAKDEYRGHFEARQDPRGAQDNAVMGGMIKSMDESLGRVLDTLEARGLMENTLILFASDNGGNMYDRTARDGTNLGAWAPEGRTPTNNAPLRGGKGSVYEGGIRVPTMVYWPGVCDSATVNDVPVNTIDYYPTLLDILGIDPSHDQLFDGVSIVPALQGHGLQRDALYGHFPHDVPAVPCLPASWVRQGDWKLIRFYLQDDNFPDRIELYNLRDDIGEVHNLAEPRPDVVRHLEALLDAHLTATGALVPAPNPNYRPDANADVQGWRPSSDCWLEAGEAGLRVHSTGGDPFIVTDAVPDADGALTLRFRMRSTAKGGGQVFWVTRGLRQFGPKQRLDFAPNHDGAWHEYTIAFDASAPLTGLRIDPAAAAGEIDVAWVALELTGDGGKTLGRWDFPEM